jgi:hypothetical protein
VRSGVFGGIARKALLKKLRTSEPPCSQGTSVDDEVDAISCPPLKKHGTAFQSFCRLSSALWRGAVANQGGVGVKHA